MESTAHIEETDSGRSGPRKGLSTNLLVKFSQFSELGEERLSVIAAQSSVERVSRNQRLIDRGTEDDCVLFLIKGSLRLESGDGAARVLESDSPAARYAVSYLSPHRYTVTANSTAKVLRVSRALLESNQQERTSQSYVVENIETGNELRDNLLFHEVYQACINETLKLPSLPDVAMKVRTAVEDERADAAKVARVVEADPPIAAKLIKAANSAYAGVQKPVDKTSAAIVRLGMKTTKQLVISFALKDLFDAGTPVLQKRMKKLWIESAEIAATCFVFAEMHPKFEPETALLAGLLHDIGIIPIVAYSRNYPDIAVRPDQLERVIEKLRGQIGCMILRYWGLSDDMVSVAVESDDWFRMPSEPPDYCALVMFAKYLAAAGQPGNKNFPPVNNIPSFVALGLGDLDPERSEDLANKVRDRVLQTNALLET